MIGILGQSETAEVIHLILDRGYFPWVLIVGAIVLTSLFKYVARAVTGVAREQSRREIAAFIAEGTMSSDQGERLMNAGKKREA